MDFRLLDIKSVPPLLLDKRVSKLLTSLADEMPYQKLHVGGTFDLSHLREMIKVAHLTTGMVLSEDELHRYLLWYVWDESKPLYTFVMLNPSKATHLAADPTVLRQAKRVMMLGGGGLIVANTFSLRETDRAIALASADLSRNENKKWILAALNLADKVVLAYGVDAHKRGGEKYVRRALRKSKHDEAWAVELNKDGIPKHPLYLAYDTPLVVAWQRGANR